MKHIIKSIVLTTEYTRYAGDHNNILSLVVTKYMKCYLWYEGNTVKVQHITNNQEYIEWLFYWNEALLDLEAEYWWDDRTVPNGRYKEFHHLLKYETLRD